MKILRFNEYIKEEKVEDFTENEINKAYKSLKRKGLKNCNIKLKDENPNCGSISASDCSDDQIAKYLGKQEAETFMKLSKKLDKLTGYKIKASDYKLNKKDSIIINKINEYN